MQEPRGTKPPPSKRRHRATNADRFEHVLATMTEEGLSPFEWIDWYFATSANKEISTNRPRLFNSNWDACGRPLITKLLGLCGQSQREDLVLQ